MASGVICDRCGAVIQEFDTVQANQIKIYPYVDAYTVSRSDVKKWDLCKDCTETVMQYINNQVDMVIFKNEGAADES